MLLFTQQTALKAHLQSLHETKTTLGFVPTMGALHQGHLSLLEASMKSNAITIVSIFVNPTQFNNPEDLAKYPRTLESDIEKIKTVSNDIIIYAPEVTDIYDNENQLQHFDYGGIENQMEGKFRVGHFDGVGTIVKRLLEIIQPTNAYFGEKDFQQLQIVKKLVQTQHIPVNIIGCAIYREPNGLAMSSRNERLTAIERQEAALIYKTLTAVKTKFGTESVNDISKWVSNAFLLNPRFELEYFQIADEETLLPCLEIEKNKKYRAFIAVFVNNIRLIDTVSLN
jgi:pantoate--beta-alanine ligase